MKLLIVVLLAAISYAQTDMPDIVLIGDSIVDNKCNNDVFKDLEVEDPDFPDLSLHGCTTSSVDPDLESVLTQAGFTVKKFARFGWTLTQIDEYQYPKLVEYAEKRDNNIIIIFSGGGNDFGPVLKKLYYVFTEFDFSKGSLSPLWEVGGRVQDFGDKLLGHSSLVINLAPPFNLLNLGVISSSISDQMLAYEEEVSLKYSDFCVPGADGVHPDNECAQQMHEKILNVLGRYKCSEGSCECKDAYHGHQCEEDCWETNIRC